MNDHGQHDLINWLEEVFGSELPPARRRVIAQGAVAVLWPAIRIGTYRELATALTAPHPVVAAALLDAATCYEKEMHGDDPPDRRDAADAAGTPEPVDTVGVRPTVAPPPGAGDPGAA
jgi:hypothetical protein